MKEQAEAQQSPSVSKRSKRRMIFLFSLAILFLALFFFWSAFVSQGVIDGDSMEPTLHSGDRVMIFQLERVDRFNLVAFTPPKHEDSQYVKRVVGMPGDTITYENDVLKINGEIISEDYVKDDDSNIYWDFTLDDIFEQTFGLDQQPLPRTIPDNMYLVLGDNRDNSQDSRTFGLISEEDIIGVVHFRYRPIEEFGIIR